MPYPADDDMLGIWQAMADLYGHRWTSAYGASTETVSGRGGPLERLTDTVETWRRVLRGITTDEIAAGIGRCIERAEPWPPTAPQFRERCRPHREPYERPEFQGNALPQLPASQSTAAAALAQIRAGMGRSA